MNVVFITQSIGFAGAAKMLVFVANQLSIRGHRVSIVNLNISSKDVMQVVHDDVVVYNVAEPTKNKNWTYLKEIVGICKKEKAQCLIGFTTYPNMYAAIAGKLLGIPAIISERGDPGQRPAKGIKDRISQIAINSAKGGVFQTGGAKVYYGKGLQKRGVVIPNPIFIKGEVPQVAYEQREKTVVSVGRLDNYQKRYDIMLRAFQIFSEKHPEYVLKLYGEGSDTEKIKTWTQEMNISHCVRFMGLTRKPMQDIAGDGMFIISSDFEGISNSLLEAMAVGLPCVSTDHTPGGARLLITDHENGLLAPVADAQKLADAMCEFAENPGLAEKCGNNAKDVIHRFAPERIIDQWETYIQKIIE